MAVLLLALSQLPLLVASRASAPAPVVFDVTDYGARPCHDGAAGLQLCPSCTQAFRTAAGLAAKAAAKPGQRARILVPGPGTYVTGPVNVTSRTTLFVSPNAVVKGSVDVGEYNIIEPLPSYGTSRDGPHARYQALVMVTPGSTDVVLTGGGTLDGSGSRWWATRDRLAAGRPHLIEIHTSTAVEVGSLTLLNSGFWTLHPVYSKDIHIHDLNISAPASSPNTDGIDPDSSENVLIERCTISCGDDHIAIKSGLDSFGLAVAKPSRNITVRGNTHLAGRGISIGSEVSGGIEHVRVEDVLHLGPSEHGLHIKTSPTRGAYIHDVAYHNITIGDVQHDYAISLTSSYGGSGGGAATLTDIASVSYSSIRRGGNPATIHDTGCGEWNCFARRPCRNFTMVDVDMRPTAVDDWKCSHLEKESSRAVEVQPSNNGLAKCFHVV